MFRAAVISLNASGDGTGIKAGLRGSAKAPAKLTLIVNTSVAKRLGWLAGDKLEVLLGEADHHGLIRVRKNNSVGLAVVEKKGNGKVEYFSIRLGHQALYVNRSEASRWCQWDEVDGWLEIKLPRWSLETKPGKGKAEEPAIAAPIRSRPSGNSVTSSLMGDPPPGRSALAQRGAE
ncbi:hypothetical protein [Sinorhizobium medicae]